MSGKRCGPRSVTTKPRSFEQIHWTTFFHGYILANIQRCNDVVATLCLLGFCYLLMCLKLLADWQLCRPRSDAAFCGVWSGTTLFANPCVSEYLGYCRGIGFPFLNRKYETFNKKRWETDSYKSSTFFWIPVEICSFWHVLYLYL